MTGAASGIGEAVAEQLLNDGFKVLTVDIDECQIEGASILTCDVSKDGAASLIKTIIEKEFGHLDAVIHAAGICPIQMIEDLSMTDYQKVMSVNLESVLAITQAVLGFLKASNVGRIVTIGSVTSDFSATGLAAYSTSKHGLLGLTRAFATEFGEFGITANCIQPGAIVTAITREAYENDKNFRDHWINISALKRWGSPQDIANLASFLVSDKASFISGHGIYADGAAMQSV